MRRRENGGFLAEKWGCSRLRRLHLSGGFQRGPQPAFGTRPCLQGIVCYTSAERIGDGRQPDVLLMLSAAWMQIVF